MSGIPALPPPSSASAPSGLATLRKMLASDVAPVSPIRPVPGREDRRRFDDDVRQAEETGGDRSGAVRGAGGRASTADGAADDGRGGGRDGRGPITFTPASPSGAPNAAFIAQSIHQEAMGNGLHIEPWAAAIQAYRRADAGPPDGALVRRVAV